MQCINIKNVSSSLIFISILLTGSAFVTKISFILPTEVSKQKIKPFQPLTTCHSNKKNNEENVTNEPLPFIHSTSPYSRRIWFSETASSAGIILALSTLTSKPTYASSISSLCDPSVSVLKNYSSNRAIYILGSAHISTNSAQMAGQLVRETKPEAVFVELDAKRVARALPSSNKQPSNLTNEDNNVNSLSSSSNAITSNNSSPQSSLSALESSATTSTTLAEKKGGGIFNIREKAVEVSSQMLGDAIKGLYKKLENEGFNTGEEFVTAVKAGQAIGSKIILGDRDVDVTLRRLTEALSRTDIKKLLSDTSELEQSMRNFLPSNVRDAPKDMSLSKEQLSEYVETLKAKENVKVIMSNLKTLAPELYNALVAERDEFMSMGLNSLNQFQSIVAVMGIAHVDGVEHNLIRQGWTRIDLSCPVTR